MLTAPYHDVIVVEVDDVGLSPCCLGACPPSRSRSTSEAPDMKLAHRPNITGFLPALIPLVLLAPRVLGSVGARDSLTVEGALAQGDQRYAEAKFDEAREAYLGILGRKPGHFGALCRVVRTESEMGEDAQGEEQKR